MLNESRYSRLKAWTGREGRIRLSIDDGPAATEFLEDDYDEDNGDVDDDEPLSDRAERMRLSGTNRIAGAGQPHSPTSPIITLS